MRKLMLCLAALVVMLGTAARAQDFAGDWQGTLKQGNVRVVVKIAKSDHGWSATMPTRRCSLWVRLRSR